mmetsp:Transcript_23707/g.26158  ORF Transcript_23707/g.26158 Transcript_23707/m.26158 type:complete len:101 (+) Transcript_23707:589-891(+)
MVVDDFSTLCRYHIRRRICNNFSMERKKIWRARKEVNKSLMLKFTTTMATPLMRAQMFRNAAEKNIFFIVKNEYGQTVALTREDGCAALVVAFSTVNQSK